jgi:hypothetical protein
MAKREGESSSRMVWQWWWPSGTITPAVSALNEGGGNDDRGGEVARVVSALGRRGGGWGSGRVWQHAGAQARGSGCGLLKEGEGESVVVGRASREANAQGKAGRPKAKAQLGWAKNRRWAQTQKEIIFEF